MVVALLWHLREITVGSARGTCVAHLRNHHRGQVWHICGTFLQARLRVGVARLWHIREITIGARRGTFVARFCEHVRA